MTKYVAFLRGINVSGHHKVPMAELKVKIVDWGFDNPITLLNSGNIIFDGSTQPLNLLAEELADKLATHYGFQIPVMLKTVDQLEKLVASDPFKSITVTTDTRMYVSFLKEIKNSPITVPWATEDHSYQILNIQDDSVISALDLSKTKTTKGMDMLEKLFGKDMTTRNWNTILKVMDKV